MDAFLKIGHKTTIMIFLMIFLMVFLMIFLMVFLMFTINETKHEGLKNKCVEKKQISLL